LQNSAIDAVAIFAAPTDFTWLYAKLRAYGVSIITLDNNDEENSSLAHQLMDIGIVEKLKPLKKPSPARPVKEALPKEKEEREEKAPREQKPQEAKRAKEESAQVHPLMDTINKILAETEPPTSQEQEEEREEKKEEAVVREIKPTVKEQPAVKEKAAKPQKIFEELQVLKEVEDIQNAPKIIDDENAELLEKIRKLIEDYRNE
jgi:ElaB/YqjD/DUF883 family membrane-anchored ribosome-binding protein